MAQVLQIFIDDSGSSPNDKYFVLGGLAASANQWLLFSEEWKSALSQPPGISYFKTSEANAMRGEFGHGWNRRLIDQKVDELAQIATRYAQYCVHSVIRWSDYVKFFGDFKKHYQGEQFKEWANPYFLCMYALAACLTRYSKKNHIDPIWKIVVDEHGSIGRIANDVFAAIREPAIHQALGGIPSFDDDRKVLPLQAADLYAWHLHDFCVRNGLKDRDPHIKRALFGIPEIGIFFQDETLLEIRAKLFEAAALMSSTE